MAVGGGAEAISEEGELSEEEREKGISEHSMQSGRHAHNQESTELHSVHTVYVETDLAQISVQGYH